MKEIRINEGQIKILGLVSVVGIAFLYLIFCLYKTQITNHSKYLESRNEQNQLIVNNSKRGTIYGTRKDGELLPLAVDEQIYKLVISPKNIPKKIEDFYFEKLSQILPDLKKNDFYEKVSKKKIVYVELGIIDKKLVTKIDDLALEGVFVVKDFKRTYPMKDVGARFLGFVGDGEGGMMGRYGLEKQYNSLLTGNNSTSVSFFQKLLQDINLGSVSKDTNKNGDNDGSIITSIEPNVQNFLHNHLLDMKEQWGADSVSAIIIKPSSGDITAMDTVPSFDPNNYKDFDISLFNNPNIQGVYELGSIMKPITMSGGIQNRLVTPESTYHDYGFVKVNNFTIWNFDHKIRGEQTMQDVINNSLNTGAVYVENLLGKERFKNNFNNFGFETVTGVDFPGESYNITDNLEKGKTSDVDYATAAFGQGVAITPISMLRALSTLVNAGVLVQPKFIKSILHTDGNIEYVNPNSEKKENVVSSTTAKTVENMLVNLIDVGLAHGRFKDKYYKVGAKTGTAQIPKKGGGYETDRFIHSYFTFLGEGENRYAVLIFQVNPKRGALASLTLAPPATKLKDFLISYYNIPPDR